MAYKTCKQCGTSVGVRTKTCSNCKYTFEIRQLIGDVDWRTLKRGTKIKSVKGYGPNIGIYTVSKTDNNGIHCYQESAHIYLNMIERPGPAGIIKAHKVILI